MGTPFKPLHHLNKVENTKEEGVWGRAVSLVLGMKNMRCLWNIQVQKMYVMGTQESGLGVIVCVLCESR